MAKEGNMSNGESTLRQVYNPEFFFPYVKYPVESASLPS